MKITALYYPDDITLMFTLSPILKSRYAGMFDFTPDPEAALRLNNRTIVLFRFVKHSAAVGGKAYLDRLRGRYDKIVYFDDFADPRDIVSDLIGLVDVYYKKQLLADRGLYRKGAYGTRLFTDYYHERYGVEDDDGAIAAPLSAADVAKLRLSWNLGLGSYPKNRIRKGISVRLGSRGIVRPLKWVFADPASYRSGKKTIFKATARFRAGFDRKTIVFHRELFLKAVEGRPDLFLTGHLSLEEYNREMRDSVAALSPFGWGEICFRDFEAIINRTVLLKPSMDHIETWPNVYKPGKTYISLDWDAKDTVEATEAILHDEVRRREITDNAWDVYADGLRNAEKRIEGFLAEITV